MSYIPTPKANSGRKWRIFSNKSSPANSNFRVNLNPNHGELMSNDWAEFHGKVNSSQNDARAFESLLSEYNIDLSEDAVWIDDVDKRLGRTESARDEVFEKMQREINHFRSEAKRYGRKFSKLLGSVNRDLSIDKKRKRMTSNDNPEKNRKSVDRRLMDSGKMSKDYDNMAVLCRERITTFAKRCQEEATVIAEIEHELENKDDAFNKLANQFVYHLRTLSDAKRE